MDNSTVSVSTTYTAVVDELTDAFAFIMDRIDGIEDPHIAITPVYVYSELPDEEDEYTEARMFRVSISAHTEEPR